MVALQISPKIESLYGMDRQQEIIKIRERILHIGLIPKVISIPQMTTSVKIRSRNLKIGRCVVHVLSNMQNVAISRCCLVTFCNYNGKEMNKEFQRVLTQPLYSLPLKFAYLNSLHPNKRPNYEQPNKHKK